MPPPAPSPRSVYDIAKSHIQLPINRDYNALKRVLRDWLVYSTHTPLQEKPTFAAELVITVTRMPPASLSNMAPGEGGISAATLGNARATRRAGRWRALWNRCEGHAGARDSAFEAKLTSATSSTAPTIPPYVYRKVVPLHVWTAVLPWEMQRGLSFSDLRLPPNLSSSRGVESGATVPSYKTAEEEVSHDPSVAVASSGLPMRPPRQRQQEEEGATEEEDPYGVVTPSIASLENSTNAAAASAGTSLGPAATATAAAAVSSISITPPAPAMLFLSDLHSSRTHGIGFWSGAIRQPIDVLFVGPTLPGSVGGNSASFRQLRKQDGLALVMDNKISSGVLHRFFPLQEVRSPSSSPTASASPVTFRVHSFGHLDPLPLSLHPSRLGVDDRREEYCGLSFTVSPDAPFNTPEEAPRYVFEVPRHTLRPAVAAALEESRHAHQEYLRAYAARGGSFGKAARAVCNGGVTATKPSEEAADDAAIDLVVNLSKQLRADLFAKAQLCVEYVSSLEEAIAHYARMLNTGAAASAEVPLDGGSSHQADGGAGRGRSKKVWLSEDEFRWMTPEELKGVSAGGTANEQQAHASSSISADQEGVFNEPEEEAAATSQVGGEGVGAVGAVTEAMQRNTPATFVPRANADALIATSCPVKAHPAQPEAVSATRSISLQSPILRDEEEGRPSYLVPSFVGRHEAPALQSSTVVLSADKLARYPRTHSHMPELPPVDYELYELCMRLGVGQQSVLYHYHERILHEWRRELHLRRRWQQQQQSRGASEPAPTAAPSRLAEEDVQRMVSLVRDRSLQLPSDMVSLVEAVAAAN
ncbi:hypothetical protein GH5_06790 [Leishmania sp. Ghana 2012 LV757]|uniref:hypothetical protein n=1 Tax=Leishmania sp. Ghana 2012 LV757 TaxID=2803181 RepID=UPI001B600DBE|nr:hypothetical protein GH5_06790 [Leishmania sp. Ghana 2012 LV757]